MLTNLSKRKEAWMTIFLFLALVVVLTSTFHYAIINLYPSPIYVGAIMWYLGIAAIITLKIKGRKISFMNWDWGDRKYIRLPYFIPALYGVTTYILIWILGFGSIANEEVIILLGTVEVIRASATPLGEEIGWLATGVLGIYF